jgi:hypothetical protein
MGPPPADCSAIGDSLAALAHASQQRSGRVAWPSPYLFSGLFRRELNDDTRIHLAKRAGQQKTARCGLLGSAARRKECLHLGAGQVALGPRRPRLFLRGRSGEPGGRCRFKLKRRVAQAANPPRPASPRPRDSAIPPLIRATAWCPMVRQANHIIIRPPRNPPPKTSSPNVMDTQRLRCTGLAAALAAIRNYAAEGGSGLAWSTPSVSPCAALYVQLKTKPLPIINQSLCLTFIVFLLLSRLIMVFVAPTLARLDHTSTVSMFISEYVRSTVSELTGLLMP